MAAVAIVSSLPAIRGTNTWQFPTRDHDPSLTDLRLSLLDRGQSDNDGVTRRKRTGSSRNRHSWRWSWKQVLTKPFQNQTWTRRSMREKKERKQHKSSHGFQNLAKNSVEARKKMDELYRIWLSEAEDSSEESSDDEHLLRDRRRACSPWISDSDSSSSDDDTDSYEDEEEEHHVSQYVKDGPSRISEDIIPEHEGTIEESGGGSETHSEVSVDANDFSSETNLLESSKQTKTIQEAHFNNLDTELNDFYETTVKKTQSLKKSQETETKMKIAGKSGLLQHSQSPPRDGGNINEANESQSSNTNASDLSHDCLPSHEESSEGMQKTSDHFDPGAMTVGQGMTNNDPNERVIAARQTLDQDILKRVDELCAQCRDDAYERNNSKLETSLDENIMNPRSFAQQSAKMMNHDGNSFDLDSQQGSSCHEELIEKSSQDVAPDYPSSYPKTGTHQQMSSQSDTHLAKLQCEFKRFGCQFAGTNMASQLEQHMQSSLNEHLKLVSKIAQDQKEQLQSQQLEQQKQGLLIQQLTDTVNNLEKLVQKQSLLHQSQEKAVHSLKDQVKDQRKQSQRFEREVTNQIQTLSQSPITSLPTGPCAAEFIWPIKNFTRRLRRIQDGEIDDPLISEPFFTGTYGYKLSVWVYLNGRGKTLGDWVSVYARVMPSDHDKILCWPIRPTYTFTLLDQSEGEKENIVRKRKVNDIKRDGGKHHGIDRPEGGERSVIVGFDDFIAHDQLEKRKYVVDDCIYLKLEANLLY